MLQTAASWSAASAGMLAAFDFAGTAAFVAAAFVAAAFGAAAFAAAASPEVAAGSGKLAAAGAVAAAASQVPAVAAVLDSAKELPLVTPFQMQKAAMQCQHPAVPCFFAAKQSH